MKILHIQPWAVLAQVFPWVAVVCYALLSNGAQAAFLFYSTALVTGAILSGEAAEKLQSSRNLKEVFGFSVSVILINALCGAAATAFHWENEAHEFSIIAVTLFFLVPYLLCAACFWAIFYFSKAKS